LDDPRVRRPDALRGYRGYIIYIITLIGSSLGFLMVYPEGSLFRKSISKIRGVSLS
jgi:hypothetical protein